MLKETQTNDVGNIVIVLSGKYLTEYHSTYDVPNSIKLNEDLPGVILEDFVDRKLILVNDGITTNKLFVENKSIRIIKNNE